MTGGSQHLSGRGKNGARHRVKEVVVEVDLNCVVHRLGAFESASRLKAKVPDKQTARNQRRWVGRRRAIDQEVLLIGLVRDHVARIGIDDGLALDPVAGRSSRYDGGDLVGDNRCGFAGLDRSIDGERGAVEQSGNESSGVDRAVGTFVFGVGDADEIAAAVAGVGRRSIVGTARGHASNRGAIFKPLDTLGKRHAERYACAVNLVDVPVDAVLHLVVCSDNAVVGVEVQAGRVGAQAVVEGVGCAECRRAIEVDR